MTCAFVLGLVMEQLLPMLVLAGRQNSLIAGITTRYTAL